ncbi:MAG: hypothetical protein CME62_00010 [Halobacteriovoraceae bacterium]|nr:hypothetical protein [Halobacteriovoraceae bacterium]|tara:strand:+ start:11966 stop:13099 length:1134 start_codon:yes stop_codon:yes gene_type:complete
MKELSLLIILISSNLLAGQFNITVLSDQGASAAASEFVKEMSKLEPYKQLIEQNIITINSQPVIANIACEGGHSGIERLAKCDLETAGTICGEADLCPIYTSVPDIGAGGDPFPIMSKTMPWTTMLHEVIHTHGFTDEYYYTANDAPLYCRDSIAWHNGYTTNSKIKSSYRTKSKALRACRRYIPWCEEAIAAGAEVTQRLSNGRYKIGTPEPASCPSLAMGVFLGGSCTNANEDTTFRPYFCPNIMGYPHLGEDFCNVHQRHAIIKNSPNMIPPYYQKMIHQHITQKAGVDVEFQLRTPAELDEHFYGIPSVDELGSNTPTENFCDTKSATEIHQSSHGLSGLNTFDIQNNSSRIIQTKDSLIFQPNNSHQEVTIE